MEGCVPDVSWRPWVIWVGLMKGKPGGQETEAEVGLRYLGATRRNQSDDRLPNPTASLTSGYTILVSPQTQKYA